MPPTTDRLYGMKLSHGLPCDRTVLPHLLFLCLFRAINLLLLLSSFPHLPPREYLSLSSLFANRSDRGATQSYIFPAGAPSVLPLPSSLPSLPLPFRPSVRPRPREGGREALMSLA